MYLKHHTFFSVPTSNTFIQNITVSGLDESTWLESSSILSLPHSQSGLYYFPAYKPLSCFSLNFRQNPSPHPAHKAECYPAPHTSPLSPCAIFPCSSLCSSSYGLDFLNMPTFLPCSYICTHCCSWFSLDFINYLNPLQRHLSCWPPTLTAQIWLPPTTPTLEDPGVTSKDIFLSPTKMNNKRTVWPLVSLMLSTKFLFQPN